MALSEGVFSLPLGSKCLLRGFYTLTGAQRKEKSLGSPMTTDVQLRTAAPGRRRLGNLEQPHSKSSGERMWTHKEERKEENLQAGGTNRDDGRQTSQREGRPN